MGVGINHQDRMELVEVLWESKMCIMDIEYIQCTRSHQCIRSCYILCEDSIECFENFKPCRNLVNLETKYFKSFMFCKRSIHRLSYYPRDGYACSYFLTFLTNFLERNDIQIILYKGGTIERTVCQKIGKPCMNLELLGCPKAYSHNPKEEVRCYSRFLRGLLTKDGRPPTGAYL